jgi:hypothetical protein
MARLAAAGRLLWALLQELADERAYARRLGRLRRPHSREEWRRFQDERLRAKYSQGRCC